jgi:hypothetical protein
MTSGAFSGLSFVELGGLEALAVGRVAWRRPGRLACRGERFELWRWGREGTMAQQARLHPSCRRRFANSLHDLYRPAATSDQLALGNSAQLFRVRGKAGKVKLARFGHVWPNSSNFRRVLVGAIRPNLTQAPAIFRSAL